MTLLLSQRAPNVAQVPDRRRAVRQRTGEVAHLSEIRAELERRPFHSGRRGICKGALQRVQQSLTGSFLRKILASFLHACGWLQSWGPGPLDLHLEPLLRRRRLWTKTAYISNGVQICLSRSAGSSSSKEGNLCSRTRLHPRLRRLTKTQAQFQIPSC